MTAAKDPMTTPPWRALHIAMIGQKGLPATFGGIEHHVEQLGRRLAARGHRVTVFNRKGYSAIPDGLYRGMELRRAPTVPSKHLDAMVHSLTSSVLAAASRADVVHYHGLGPGLASPLSRATGSAVIQTVHGLDHQREKWGRGASSVLDVAHWMSGHVPDRTVVVSRALQDHYLSAFGRATTYVPNGVERPSPVSDEAVRALGLVPGRYLLFVGRFVPEKAVALLVRAYRAVPGDHQLVLVGDSSFSDAYARQVRELGAKDSRVVLTGYRFGQELSALYDHAGAFVQPSDVEGLPLTLLEALSHGLPVVASDIPPHVEVLGATSRPGRALFRAGDERGATAALERATVAMADDRAAMRPFCEEIMGEYDWDAATLALEQVYLRAAPPARTVAGRRRR